MNFGQILFTNGPGPTWSISGQARLTTKHEINSVMYWFFHIILHVLTISSMMTFKDSMLFVAFVGKGSTFIMRLPLEQSEQLGEGRR